MTRIRIHPLILAGLVLGVLLLSLSVGMRMGFAQPAMDAAPAAVDAAPAPHEVLDDPIAAPSATFDDLKAAKKVGWPALVFAIALIAARLVGKYGGKAFAFLGQGRVAVFVAGIGTALGAAYDASMSGGTWVAVGSTVLIVIATLLNPHASASASK